MQHHVLPYGAPVWHPAPPQMVSSPSQALSPEKKSGTKDKILTAFRLLSGLAGVIGAANTLSHDFQPNFDNNHDNDTSGLNVAGDILKLAAAFGSIIQFF